MSEARSSEDYVLAFESKDGSTLTTHFHGIPWWDAPKPRRFHRCRPQTEGCMNYFTVIQRCACGAISIDGQRWMNRNSK